MKLTALVINEVLILSMFLLLSSLHKLSHFSTQYYQHQSAIFYVTSLFICSLIFPPSIPCSKTLAFLQLQFPLSYLNHTHVEPLLTYHITLRESHSSSVTVSDKHVHLAEERSSKSWKSTRVRTRQEGYTGIWQITQSKEKIPSLSAWL